MKPKFWETKDFKSLEKEWEKKLSDSGFVDAEETVREERVLVQRAANAYRQATEVERENRQKYYELLCQFSAEEVFDDPVEKLVLTRRAVGATIKTISTELKRLGERSYRNTIRYIIRKYENRWGIKTWKPEQMKSRPCKTKK